VKINYLFTWQRGYVVKMSVSGRRTFPTLRPIYGWQVTTLWVNCRYGSANHANSALYPSRVV